MANYKPIDGNKEDFRKYLDQKGVMDALTKAFVKCYQERPDNPMEQLIEQISTGTRFDPTETQKLRADLKIAQDEVESLRKQLAELKAGTAAAAATPPAPAVAPAPAPVVNTTPAPLTKSAATSTDSPAATGAIPKEKRESTESANSAAEAATSASAEAPKTSAPNTSESESNEAIGSALAESTKEGETTVAAAAPVE